MEIQAALQLLNVNESASLEDVNTSFRKLIKIHHPDIHENDTSISHEITTRLNEAYAVLLRYFSSSTLKEPINSTLQPRSPFLKSAEKILDSLLQGIFIYYQYGLENIYQRGDGIHRLKYKLSLKIVNNASHQLHAISKKNLNIVENKIITQSQLFSELFYKAMLISEGITPSHSPYERKAFKHYANASVYLDRVIKNTFFSDLGEHTNNRDHGKDLGLCYSELLFVSTKYYRSEVISSTLLKLYLIQIFEMVVKILRKFFQHL
jgi:hypothetical protein